MRPVMAAISLVKAPVLNQEYNLSPCLLSPLKLAYKPFPVLAIAMSQLRQVHFSLYSHFVPQIQSIALYGVVSEREGNPLNWDSDLLHALSSSWCVLLSSVP